MKVKLLNCGMYPSLMYVNFPVEVEARFDTHVPDGSAIFVPFSELLRVGGLIAEYNNREGEKYFIDYEFEVIS